MKDSFITAIKAKKKVIVTFNSNKKGTLVRTCAPMDYGPSSRFKDGLERYHFWDYFPDDGKAPHPLPLLHKNIQSLEVLEESFDPGEFVKWSPTSWHVPRDWGQHS